MQNGREFYGKDVCVIEFEKITSRKNSNVVSAAGLSDKKRRDASGLFFVEGAKLFEEVLLCGIKVKEVYFTSDAKERHIGLLNEAACRGCKAFEVTPEVYDRLSSEKSPEGIFAVAEKFLTFERHGAEYADGGFLILEDVQDPSNVGTVIRTACALGIKKILLTKACADVFGIKCLRASMGALFRAKIYRTDDLLSELSYFKEKGIRIIATSLGDDSEDISGFSFRDSDCIIIGSEGRGISDSAEALCDKKLIIPMEKGAESLNAAAAAAIFIWEKQKRRNV